MSSREDRSPRSWRRGLIAASVVVTVAEIVFVASMIAERGLFDYVALDYRGTRSAGEAILRHGLGAAYEPSLLEASQRRMYDGFVRVAGHDALPFGVVPAPYPAPFSLAFVPSTVLPPVFGFVVWTMFHALVLVLYQIRLARAFGVTRPFWLVVAVLLSPPALIHLVMGQISVWLMVFFGEAIIAFRNGQGLRAGVWLGLMMIKPQALVLLVPAMAVAGQWRVLCGMGLAGVAAVVPTLFVEPGWVVAYARELTGFFSAQGTVLNTFPTSMTTWRAFALNASRLLPPPVAWTVAVGGMIVTGCVGLACGRVLSGDRREGDPSTGFAWLGLAAATNVFAWHAHVHQSLLLVPPLYWIIGMRPGLQRPVEAVCLGLSAVFLAAVWAASVGFAHDLLGMSMLAVLAVTAVGSGWQAFRARWM